MVNLLTPPTRRSLTLRYYLHLGTGATAALALAFVVGAVILLPSYFVVHADADQASTYVNTATAIANQRAKSESTETLTAFKEEVDLLQGARGTVRIAKMLSYLTEDVPKGISIDKVDIHPGDKGVLEVNIDGMAATRAILIAYRDQLKRQTAFENVAIPVSDFVADVNSGFSLHFTFVDTTP